MIELQSDLHSRTTPHTSSLRASCYGVPVVNYTEKNNRDISRAPWGHVSTNFSLFVCYLSSRRYTTSVSERKRYISDEFNSPDQVMSNVRHDDVTKWKHFPRYWPFVRGIHRSPVNSPHKSQWRGALMFPLICGWANNREAGDLRRHRAHYDVSVMVRGKVTLLKNSTPLTTQEIPQHRLLSVRGLYKYI